MYIIKPHVKYMLSRPSLVGNSACLATSMCAVSGAINMTMTILVYHAQSRHNTSEV